jgi:hypothetical protein
MTSFYIRHSIIQYLSNTQMSLSENHNLEASVINFTRLESLKLERDNPFSKFDSLAIEVTTKPNSGVVETSDINYTMKCCFIAISHGLNDILSFELTPFDLMSLANFLEPYTLIDTDNPVHLECLQQLVECLPDIKLHFFIGQYDGNQWKTTPDPSVVIGSGKQIIRILNKGCHFELIITGGEQFVRAPNKSHEFYVQQQQNEEHRIKTCISDQEMAKQVEDELSVEYNKKCTIEEVDRQYAMCLQNLPLGESCFF